MGKLRGGPGSRVGRNLGDSEERLALDIKMPRGVKRKANAPALAAIGEDENGSIENANTTLLAKKIEQIDIQGNIDAMPDSCARTPWPCKLTYLPSLPQHPMQPVKSWLLQAEKPRVSAQSLRHTSRQLARRSRICLSLPTS